MFDGLFKRAQLDRVDIQELRFILNERERALDVPIEQTPTEANENAEGKRLANIFKSKSFFLEPQPKPTHAKREQQRRGTAQKRQADEAAVIPQRVWNFQTKI